MDVALLEKVRCRAKNEVNMPRDVAALEVMAATIGENRILPAEKPAVAKHHAVAINADGQRLAHGSGGVFKRDVFRREIVRINLRRRRAERADGFAVLADELAFRL